MDIRFLAQIKQAFRDIESMSTLILALSESLRQAEERIQKLENSQNGNRQRRTPSGN